MPTYVVTATQGEHCWTIRAAGVHGEASAAHAEDVERIARKFVALHTGQATDDIRVLVELSDASGPTTPAWWSLWPRLRRRLHIG